MPLGHDQASRQASRKATVALDGIGSADCAGLTPETAKPKRSDRNKKTQIAAAANNASQSAFSLLLVVPGRRVRGEPRIHNHRRQLEIPGLKIIQVRVFLFDQADLPVTPPLLEFLLPRNGGEGIVVDFEPHQLVDAVSRSEPFDRLCPMFVHSPHDIVGHAEIERAVLLAREEIDVIGHLCRGVLQSQVIHGQSRESLKSRSLSPIDLPDGLIFRIGVKSFTRKYFSFSEMEIGLYAKPSRLDKRDVRVVTNVRRDAMDAGCARDDVRLLRGRRSRVVLTPLGWR
jgi:hypothetical protein